MSKAEYLSYLTTRANTLEERIQTDKDRLESGTPQEKVKAAGDLAVVERRLEETKKKISRLEAEPEGAWENFKAEIEQDFDYMEADFDRWTERLK